MGYSTEFNGEFKINKPVDEETYTLLCGLATTRRMARNVSLKYGVEGEFYIKGKGMMGQDHEKNIIDFNRPPKTQPGLWCQWAIQDDRKTIAWDGGEKFYEYVEWLQYLIDKVFKIRGYVLNGEVWWQGEDNEDFGRMEVHDNVVHVHRGRKVVIEEDDLYSIKTAIMEKVASLGSKREAEFILTFINHYFESPDKEFILLGTEAEMMEDKKSC